MLEEGNLFLSTSVARDKPLFKLQPTKSGKQVGPIVDHSLRDLIVTIARSLVLLGRRR